MRSRLTLSVKPENLEKFKAMCGAYKYSTILDKILENTSLTRLSENSFLIDPPPEIMAKIRQSCRDKGVTVSELINRLVEEAE
jgi:hypothetical protein